MFVFFVTVKETAHPPNTSGGCARMRIVKPATAILIANAKARRPGP